MCMESSLEHSLLIDVSDTFHVVEPCFLCNTKMSLFFPQSSCFCSISLSSQSYDRVSCLNLGYERIRSKREIL